MSSQTVAPPSQTTATDPAPPPVTSLVPTVVRDLNWTPAIWLLLIVVCGALFLDGLDLSMIGVALPSIGRSLHLPRARCNGSSAATCSVTASFLLLGGRTADLISRRTVFLTAVSVFGVASVLSAFVGSESRSSRCASSRARPPASRSPPACRS